MSEVCASCGWYKSLGLEGYHVDCKQRGAYAKALRETVSNVPSTQLGYGHGFITFEPDHDFHIRFNVRSSKPLYTLEQVWLLADLTLEQATDLVRVLVDWWRSAKPEFERGYDQAVDEIIGHFKKLEGALEGATASEVVSIIESIWKARLR